MQINVEKPICFSTNCKNILVTLGNVKKIKVINSDHEIYEYLTGKNRAIRRGQSFGFIWVRILKLFFSNLRIPSSCILESSRERALRSVPK